MTDLSGRTLGRYRLESLLGQGGMAEVWRATDTKLARPVAVKVIHATFARDPRFVERFLREARVVASLEHPNILPVYDFGEEDGLPFLVMPYLSGGTLRDRLRGTPAPLPVAAAWIRQLADALDAAHAAGVLHRDVKPANVLVGREDRLFLADFGIAKMVETMTGLTATGVVVGTPTYMAPEQAQGQPASPATDRYALAVVAFEILAGRPPFGGDNPLSLMHQHVSTPAPALSSKVDGLPAGLDSVLGRALSKNPGERPETCRALADAVSAFLPAGVTAAGAATSPTVVLERRATPPPVRVATPPPSLTSDATVLTPGRRRRRGLAWGAGAAAVALVGLAIAGREKKDRTGDSPGDSSKVKTAAGAGPASPAAPPAAAPPNTLSESPRSSSPSASDEKRIAELEQRVRDAEETARAAQAAAAKAAATPVPARPVPLPPPPAVAGAAPVPPAADEPARDASALAAARERLDAARKTGRRLTKEDFEFVAGETRRVLAGHPRNPEAQFLSAYAAGGLAYVAGKDAEAGALAAEAAMGMRRAGKPEPRVAGLFAPRPDGSVAPPRGWELALCYGDARDEALGLLDEAVRENPRDVRARRARAQLQRARGLGVDLPLRPGRRRPG